jgi:DUF4097 and DUF4098 domain-containing protein YvlB
MYEFDCPNPVALSVHLGGGDAEIIAEDTDRAVVEVTGADGSDAARQAAARTRVELVDGVLVVDAPESGGWGFRRTPRVNVNVRLPRGGDLFVKLASANVRALGSYADAKLNSASGDISVEHIAGDAAAGTASGLVNLNRVDGGLRLNSASGTLAVDDVGGDLGAHSASGDIQIGTVGGSVDITTASGDVRLGTVVTGDVKVKSASGDVSVGIASGTGVWLDLITMSGDTRSDLEISQNGEPSTATLTLQVRTASGDIHIHRSPSAAMA